MKIECLIRNMEWRYNPSSFECKIKDGDKPVTLTVGSVTEFGVSGYPSYASKEVTIDRSPDFYNDLEALSTVRDPAWSKEKLFLKIIFKGPATLYSYEGNHITRYFYEIENGPVEQLIYKAYRIDETNFVYNKTFQSQLKEKLDCGNPNIDKLEYNERDLKKYFSFYSAAKGNLVVEQQSTIKRQNNFSMKLFTGVSFASLQSRDLGSFSDPSYITKFDSKINPVIGAEFEYFLPFNKGKWSIPLDLYNRNYKAAGKDPNGLAQTEYDAVELATGARYYSYISSELSIYLNVYIVEDFKTKSNFFWQSTTSNFYPNHYSIDIKTHSPIFSIGAGASYKKIYAECRYYMTRELFEDYVTYGSSFNSISLLVKYKIF